MSAGIAACQQAITGQQIAGHPLREVEIDGQCYREWAGYLFRSVVRGKAQGRAFELIPNDAHAMRLMILEALQ